MISWLPWRKPFSRAEKSASWERSCLDLHFFQPGLKCPQRTPEPKLLRFRTHVLLGPPARQYLCRCPPEAASPASKCALPKTAFLLAQFPSPFFIPQEASAGFPNLSLHRAGRSDPLSSPACWICEPSFLFLPHNLPAQICVSLVSLSGGPLTGLPQ